MVLWGGIRQASDQVYAENGKNKIRNLLTVPSLPHPLSETPEITIYQQCHLKNLRHEVAMVAYSFCLSQVSLLMDLLPASVIY